MIYGHRKHDFYLLFFIYKNCNKKGYKVHKTNKNVKRGDFIVLVLLSASVERVGVSCSRYFYRVNGTSGPPGKPAIEIIFNFVNMSKYFISLTGDHKNIDALF